jgi:hypothetical protein
LEGVLEMFFGPEEDYSIINMDKGNICEEDALRVLGIVNNKMYFKNKTAVVNDFITGMADAVSEIIDDTKCSYDMDSLITQNYHTCINGKLKAIALATETEGSVDYCLVNNQYIKSQAQKILYGTLWGNRIS